MDGRRAAFAALKRVSQGAYSNIALGEILGENTISDADRALASTIFYGVLERESGLDELLRGYLSKPLNRLEKDVLTILRIGMYQLCCLDRIPDSAAVNESVVLARRVGLSRATGLINAVLRSYVRAGKPKPKESSICPAWITDIWERGYGKELCDKTAGSIAGQAPIYARFNNVQSEDEVIIKLLSEDGFTAQRVDFIDHAYRIVGRGSVEDTKAYREGLLHIQDIASQLACALSGVREDMSVLDVCSAPGGKSFTLAEQMNGTGRVVACDIHPHRVRLIELGAERLGLDNIFPTVKDALSDYGSLSAQLVLCDVPCSGLGIIRRKPDIMKKTAEEIADLPQLQLDILEHNALRVERGGTLMYSTCTLNPSENGEVVSTFLNKHPEFEPYPLELPEGVGSVIDEPSHCLTLFPHMLGSDGFFIARMRRVGDA